MQFQTGTLPDKGLGLERTSRLGAVMPSQKKRLIFNHLYAVRKQGEKLSVSLKEREGNIA